MIETLTLISLCVLYLIYFRPGKTPPLDNPLIIERPGHYHATLAPQLNLAQPFIEDIAKQLGSGHAVQPDDSIQVFEVYDAQVTAYGGKFYLLTISQRAGLLYFQATHPTSPTPTHLHETIENSDPLIITQTQKTALRRGISIKYIPNAT